jgi:hypothetical protein
VLIEASQHAPRTDEGEGERDGRVLMCDRVSGRDELLQGHKCLTKRPPETL